MKKESRIIRKIGQGKHMANNRFGYTFDIQKLLEIKRLGAVLIFEKDYIKWKWKKEEAK